MTDKVFSIGFLATFVAITLFQDRFVFGGFTKRCLCPQYVDSNRLRGYCGHEILEQRASAKPSTRICQPNFVYYCDYGPNGATFELKCEKNQTCIEGSKEAYKRLNNNTRLDSSSSLLRFCAANEGKTSSIDFIQRSISSYFNKWRFISSQN